MLFLGRRDIVTREISTPSVLLPPLIQVNGDGVLGITGWRLATAMARTIASRHLNNFEFFLDILSAYFSLDNIVQNNTNNFRLRYDRLHSLRDFSRTNKIGELGQAVVWLYLMENGYPFIDDFEMFCNLNGINVPHNSPRPDFISKAINITNDICLVEAKGKETYSSQTLQSKLKKGLNQCDIGALLLNGTPFNVIKKMVFCTAFSNENNAIDTKLNFTDPKLPSKNEVADGFHMRIHYASWFYMIGDFDNVNNLIKGERIQIDDSIYKIETIGNEKYWTIPLFNQLLYLNMAKISKRMFFPLLDSLFFPYDKVKWGITEDIVKILQNGNNLPIKKNKMESSDGNELFSDGTGIFNITPKDSDTHP